MSTNASIPNALPTNSLRAPNVLANANAAVANASNAPKLNAAANVANAANAANAPAVGGRSKKKVTSKRGGNNVKVPNTPVAAPNAKPSALNTNVKPANALTNSKPASVNTAGNAPTTGGRGKKGGALVDDLKNLAVPFAILLAKQGVENMYAKKSAKGSTKDSPKSASKTTSARRRATLSGGACTSGCGMTGGRRGGSSNAEAVKHNFSKIAADIDKFLAKY